MLGRRVFWTVLLAALSGLAGTARAATPNLNPFRAPAVNLLDPVRQVAQAQPAPAQPPAPAPAATPLQACKRDAECPGGTICTDGLCRPFERAINILLFRKEGPVTVFLPFYYGRRGTPGYRVIAPLYWHFWSADDKAKIVAPFYWRFEDYLKQRVIIVVGPYVHTEQPDAQSWAIWPLFYRSTKFGWAAPLLASFKIESPDQGKATGLYGLLYFWRRSPGRAFDLLFPLFVSSRSEGGAFTWALPLNFYWRGGDEKNLIVAPLFYRRWDRRTALTISLLGYRSTSPDGANGALLWLYWYGRAPAKSYDVLFPLLWSFRSPEANTTVVLPVLHFRRGPSAFTSVLPLWFSASNSKEGSSWKLLLPLFFSRTRDHGRSLLWVTPLGGFRRNDEAGSRSLTFLIPPLIRRKDANREFESYLLLYWRYHDIAGGSKTTVIGPFYGRDDAEGSTRVGFPLFWSFREASTGARAWAFVPFLFRRTGPEETATAVGIFPTWFYHRRFADGGRSFGLLPLAYFGWRGPKRHAVVLPFLYHFKDDRESSTLALPLFFHFASEHRASTGVLPLLYFQGRDHGDSYKVQLPLFWRFVDGDAKTRTTVIPPFFHRARPDGWVAGLAPLLFAGGGGPRRHFVLFPLFWHFGDDTRDRSTTMVLNYLHRRHGGEVTDALFPLLHFRRGARPGGADETSFTLLPLVHYQRTAKRTVFVSPLAVWGRGPERKAGMVLPYFWYESRRLAARGIPPLWFDVTRVDTGERTRGFGPYFMIDAPGRKARVLFPFAARYEDDKESGTYVFPTFFHRRTKAGYAVDTFFPLFWRSSWPGHTTTVVGPFFRRTGPGSFSTGLPPLFVYASSAERRLVVTPLFYRRSDFKAGTSRTFAWLFYASSSAEESRSILFPLWWAARHGEQSHRVLFPIFWRFADGKENWSFNLLGPLLWSHNGSKRTRGLVPLAWYSRDPEQGWGSNALLPLFYEKHARNDQMFLTLPFGFRKRADRFWFYVPPLVYRDTWASRFWTLFPVWFQHTDKISDSTTRVVPPLLYYGRSSPDRALHGALLLFWRHRDITSSTTLGLPLFYDINSYHERRITMLVPLFLRYKNQVTDTSYTFAPLFYRRSSPGDSSTVLFPLLWDFRSDERRTTVVFPLYVGVRRPTWQGRYIFPNIWYRTGLGPETGTSRLFVFPLWESAVKRPGDYMWEALLGLFGWERIGRNRFLKLFFIPFELEPAPPARTAWYGRPTPPSRTRRVRGVSAQVW